LFPHIRNYHLFKASLNSRQWAAIIFYAPGKLLVFGWDIATHFIFSGLLHSDVGHASFFAFQKAVLRLCFL
jgi:hypothetical protein